MDNGQGGKDRAAMTNAFSGVEREVETAQEIAQDPPETTL